LRESPLAALRKLLPDRVIVEACARSDHSWRDRKYGPVVTVFHYLLQAIGREESFASTWQDLWTTATAEVPDVAGVAPDVSALTHARGRLPRRLMQELAKWACDTCPRPDAMWHGMRLKAFDGCSVSMPRNDDLVAHFGLHNTRHGIVRYPLARFVSLLDLGQCTIVDWRLGVYADGEATLAQQSMESVAPGDLCLGDKGFTGGPTLARIAARKADCLGRKPPRLKPENAKIVRRLGRNDWIVELPVNRPARKKDPTLPETIRVRLFKATWRAPSGRKLTEWFVTSLEDRAEFPPKMLAELYHARWRIETSYAEFKQTFHTDVLRSKTVDNVYKEFAAHVLAYQLVRRLMVEAARAHHKKPTDISFINAVRWTLSFSRHMAASHVAALPEIYDRLLAAIAASEVDVRPGRLDPRAIARETKHYPRLRESRAAWRARVLGKGA
jgi:hypothetical protein